MTYIIIVNEKDEEIGVAEKLFAHQNSHLHRAFSVFVYRKKNDSIELLLQKRSLKKYHSGGLWTNTCCSHPQPGEKIKAAATKRLKEEVGINHSLCYVDKFLYTASLDNGMYENEFDHLFVCEYNESIISPNLDEVEEVKWISLEEINKDYSNNPQKYTAWFKEALDIVVKNMNWHTQ